MAALGARAAREPLAIVLTAVGQANAPTESELQATLPLQPIFQAPEGVLYLTNKPAAP